MAVIPVVHRSAAVHATLRRGLPRRGIRLVRCRELRTVRAILGREVVDAVVVDVRAGSPTDVFGLVGLFPGIPLFAWSAFRPSDGSLLLACRRAGIRVIPGGVDDAAMGEFVAAGTASRRRRAHLRDAPAVLRLTEPLQIRAWDEVFLRVGAPMRTGEIARHLGMTREHLSREFAAGGAPNLKRVIDLARILCAADLLANPGYDVVTVGRVLRFASPSHLAASSRRIAGVTPIELRRLTQRQVLARFLKGRTRSRL